MGVCEWVSGQSLERLEPVFILKMGFSFWPRSMFLEWTRSHGLQFQRPFGPFFIVKRHLKCVQNLRARSDVSKNGVKKSNWIKNDRLMELWKFLNFTNPSSDGGTHIQWSIMFHSLSYHQSSQIQFLSSDQPKLLSRFVIVDDHFIRNIIYSIQPRLWISSPIIHNFGKTQAGPRGCGKKPFLRGKNPLKPCR